MKKIWCKFVANITRTMHTAQCGHICFAAEDGSWSCFHCDKVWKTSVFSSEDKRRLVMLASMNDKAPLPWLHNAIVRLIEA